jgi:hypothetical protein
MSAAGDPFHRGTVVFWRTDTRARKFANYCSPANFSHRSHGDGTSRYSNLDRARAHIYFYLHSQRYAHPRADTYTHEYTKSDQHFDGYTKRHIYAKRYTYADAYANENDDASEGTDESNKRQ